MTAAPHLTSNSESLLCKRSCSLFARRQREGVSRGRWHFFRSVLITLILLLSPTSLRADGGIVRLRETQGPFTVTLFSPSEVATRIPTDLTIMVQNPKTGETIMDALVDVSVSAPTSAKLPPGDPFCSAPGAMPSPSTLTPGASPTFRATRSQAANKLLYGIPIAFHAPGNWQLRVIVRHGSDSAAMSSMLPVETASPRLSGLWLYLLMPPCVIALFILNQWLRATGARPSPDSASPDFRLTGSTT